MVRDALRVGLGEPHPDVGARAGSPPSSSHSVRAPARAARGPSSPESPTPTSRSGPGRSRSARSSSEQASSPIRVGVVDADVERGRARADREVRVAELRRHRARGLLRARAGGRRAARPSGAARRAAARRRRRRARTSPRPRSRCARSRPRAAAGRSRCARSRTSRPTLPGSRRAELARRRARRARRSSRCRPRRASPRRAARRPGSTRIGNGARNAASRPGPDDREPARLAPVGGDLRHHLRGRDAERAREPRPRLHDGPHGLGERARVVEGRRDLAEVEVALVDPGLLDGRHDLAHDRPDLARVLAVERAARADEDGLRAAPERLGARHRRDDAEAPRDVVRGRDDAAAVRVAADDERHPPQLRVLELLDGGEERVQVEVRDDHASSVVR